MKKIIEWFKNLFKIDNIEQKNCEFKELDTVNNYKNWTDVEEDYLINLINDGLSYNEISYILERTENAIYQRAKKLVREGRLK